MAVWGWESSGGRERAKDLEASSQEEASKETTSLEEGGRLERGSLKEGNFEGGNFEGLSLKIDPASAQVGWGYSGPKLFLGLCFGLYPSWVCI